MTPNPTIATLLGAILALACNGEKQKRNTENTTAPIEEPVAQPAAISDASTPSKEAPMSSSIVSLSKVSVQRNQADQLWEVLVDVTFTNHGKTTFELDKVTGCVGGRLRNAVFNVKQGGQEIAYQGAMAKRAHPGPDGFLRIEPGSSHTERVDIGTWYAMPSSGIISVAFDHYNHFSKDEVQLTSEPISIELTPAAH